MALPRLRARNSTSAQKTADAERLRQELRRDSNRATTEINKVIDAIVGDGGVALLGSSTSPREVAGTSTVTRIVYEQIAGGALKSGMVLRLRTGGSYTNNSGANRTIVFSVAFGGEFLWRDETVAQAASATPTTWSLELDIPIESPTLVHMHGVLRQSFPAVATDGLGDITTPAITHAPIGTVVGGVTVPHIRVATSLTVNVNHSNSHAAISLVRTYYTFEVVRPADA